MTLTVDDFLLTGAQAAPPSAAEVTPDQLALIEFANQNPGPRPVPERDHQMRYVLPDPETGEKKTWMRATTMAGTLDETFGLEKWNRRNVARGLALRPDLLDQVARLGNPTEQTGKAALDGIIEQAQLIAGSKLSADLGTAMHSVLELLDLDPLGLPPVPAPWHADVAAYQQRLIATSIELPAEWVERIVVVPQIGVAGTLDRIGTRHDWSLPRIVDFKSGRRLDYSWPTIAAQLAIYSRARWLWSETGYEPMPSVDQDTAVVIHMPVGSADCRLYEVDIAAGWEAVQLAVAVRAMQKRKGLARPFSTFEKPKPTGPRTTIATTAPTRTGDILQEATPVPADRTAWIKGRMAAIKDQPEAVAILTANWPTPNAKGPWADEEIDLILPVLDAAEGRVRAPFPEHSDPAVMAARPISTIGEPNPLPPIAPDWPTPDEGDLADPIDIVPVAQAIQDLDVEAKALVASLKGDSKRAGRPWSRRTDGLSERGLAISRAVINCVTHLGTDALIRSALAETVGAPLEPSWRTGAVIGSLTVDHAKVLDLIASAAAEDPDVLAELSAT